jgi:putative oxidoreductase
MMAARLSATVLLRLVLGGLMLVAGALKLRDPAGFAVEIANYQLLPVLSPYLAATLPAVEVVLGIGLLIAPAIWRRAAAVGAAILFAMFAVAVGSAYLRDINIACGCFGGGGDAIGPLTLARNVSLLVGVAALLVLDVGSGSAKTPGPARGDDQRPASHS